jgi:hypothetical protein
VPRFSLSGNNDSDSDDSASASEFGDGNRGKSSAGQAETQATADAPQRDSRAAALAEVALPASSSSAAAAAAAAAAVPQPLTLAHAILQVAAEVSPACEIPFSHPSSPHHSRTCTHTSTYGFLQKKRDACVFVARVFFVAHSSAVSCSSGRPCGRASASG